MDAKPVFRLRNPVEADPRGYPAGVRPSRPRRPGETL